MRTIIFPSGNLWVLDDPKVQELAIVEVEAAGLAVLVFSDEDLAATYAEKNNLAGKKPRLVRGAAQLLHFLTNLRMMGVALLAVDHETGRQVGTVSIDKAIEYARKQTGQSTDPAC